MLPRPCLGCELGHKPDDSIVTNSLTRIPGPASRSAIRRLQISVRYSRTDCCSWPSSPFESNQHKQARWISQRSTHARACVCVCLLAVFISCSRPRSPSFLTQDEGERCRCPILLCGEQLETSEGMSEMEGWIVSCYRAASSRSGDIATIFYAVYTPTWATNTWGGLDEDISSVNGNQPHGYIEPPRL
jgi:hypothetical protein